MFTSANVFTILEGVKNFKIAACTRSDGFARIGSAKIWPIRIKPTKLKT
jgi:hypothetical protein